jgi:hypothetical protein
MTSKDWIALASVLATVMIAVVSLFMSARQQARHQRREDDLVDQHRKREDELRQVRREDAPRLEFTIEGETFGEPAGEHLLILTVAIRNRGLIRWKLKSILLRIRGIETGQPFGYWKGHEPRIEFPISVVNAAEIVPSTLNYIFVEPGVEQAISYVTRLPAGVEYALVHVEFHYDNYTPHTSERVFHVLRR